MTIADYHCTRRSRREWWGRQEEMENRLALAVWLGLGLTESRRCQGSGKGPASEQQGRTNKKKQLEINPRWCCTFFETSNRNPRWRRTLVWSMKKHDCVSFQGQSGMITPPWEFLENNELRAYLAVQWDPISEKTPQELRHGFTLRSKADLDFVLLLLDFGYSGISSFLDYKPHNVHYQPQRKNVFCCKNKTLPFRSQGIYV